uniref:Single-stranded DNA binding protein Ssb-like OB fold domain-containing protein n=1 Tax=Leersia perrieri TaxID=77586 RepID=A0A0D9UYU1_9ORYZ
MSTPAAGEKPALRKPVFTKVDQLKPVTSGHTLTVKVVSANPVPGRARPGVGATVILRNAKIDMFKGSMRLAVDKWGRIEATEPASFTVKEDNNLSLVEYELVNVAE